MLTLDRKHAGFTIVELLVVIVVIAILATISVVAYNGVQARARDSKRQSDLRIIANALEMYRADKGGYPTCAGMTYQPGWTHSNSTVANCLNSTLVPAYIASLPTDPINVAPNIYYYGVGIRKTATNAYAIDQSDNYILGARMESAGGPNYSGWSVTLNYLAGSSN